MNNHLYPIKLHTLLKNLVDTEVFRSRIPPKEIRLNSPDDDKTRVMLFANEVHHAVCQLPDLKVIEPISTRKRLAIPNKRWLGHCWVGAMFEVYTCEGELIYSQPVEEVKGYLSAAIEVELLSMLLESHGHKIDMV